MITPPPPQLRVARPSRDLNAATAFYARGLGLRVLARFEDHAGIDGVILGHPDWPYHIELTQRRSNPELPARSDEDLIVFYLPDHDVWSSTVEGLRALGAREIVNANPYWTLRECTFEDPDGNPVVLQNAAWTAT
jgi:catechol 2,3-dioxygenase-like lactoylglutathione lyase family enzyme